MTNKEIIDKLWQLCDVLRDDGITYHQYLNELTFILFLKMAEETDQESILPAGFMWSDLKELKGVELKIFYQKLLFVLGGSITLFKNIEGETKENLTKEELDNLNKEIKDKKQHWKAIEINATVKKIYNNARTNIDEPKNLKKIINKLDELDWYNAKQEGLGDIYEGLLEKNAGEKKSGAGQYFTPRALINVMVRCMQPKVGEKWNDPACGTFGFMIAIDHFLREKFDNYQKKVVNLEFQRNEALSGIELVRDAYRLALMNAILHDLSGEHLYLGDSLSSFGEQFIEKYDGVLANPPFGTKKGGERPTHGKLTFKTLNKQLNFLQHIYHSLNRKGGARAAVVLPDNVLFASGDGQKVRADLMDKCNLHTILRLPNKAFDYADVQTNVVFFERGKTEKRNTKEIWFYDLRSNMPSFGKRTPLDENHFSDFEKAYHAKDRKKVSDPRWSVVSRKEVIANDNNLDIGIMDNKSRENYRKLPAPEVIATQTKVKLQETIQQLDEIIKELAG